MKQLCLKILFITLLTASAALILSPLKAQLAHAQNPPVTHEDLNKILERLDALTRQNKELEKKNAEIISENQELSSRIKILEQNSGQNLKDTQPPQNVQELSNRVQELEKQIRLSPGKDGDLAGEFSLLQDDVIELSDIMQKVERKSLMDKLRISADLRNRFDWFTYSSDKFDTNEHVSNIPSLRFRLNLSTDLLDNLKFNARLTMHKIWNAEHTSSYPYNNFMNSNNNNSNNNNSSRMEKQLARVSAELSEEKTLVGKLRREYSKLSQEHDTLLQMYGQILEAQS